MSEYHLDDAVDSAISRQTLVIVAAVYLAAALAIELLMIPLSGHAFALWPAAGFALAAILRCGPRCWPAIWIGSFLYALLLDPSPVGAMAGLIESTGVVLQALLGARLTRRFLEGPVPLGREDDIWRFLLFGGPLACLVSASAGVVVMVTFGDGSGIAVASQWFTWWVGDTLGVLLFTPLFLLVWPGGRELWPGSGLRIASSLLIISSLLVAGNFALDHLEKRRILLHAEEHYDEIYLSGLLPFATVVDLLNGVERFFSYSDDVTRREFAGYTRDIVKRPEILSIDWAPRVEPGGVKEFEEQVRSKGFPDYRVFEIDADGSIRPPGVREEYFPVLYSEPMADNMVVLGLDHGFEPQRVEAMAMARDRAKIAATVAIPLLRTADEINLVFVPVYGPGIDSATAGVDERRSALMGFVVGVLDLGRLFLPLVETARAEGFVLRVVDVTPGDPIQTLVDMPAPKEKTVSWVREIEVAGRLLHLNMRPSPEMVRRGLSNEVTVLLAFSLLAAFMVSIATLGAAGRNAATEAEVVARTVELRESEERHRRLIESSPYAIFVQSGGRFAFVNPMMRSLLGAGSDGEVLGATVLDFIAPEDRGTVKERILGLNGEAAATPSLEGSWRRLDGSRFRGEMTAVSYLHEGRQGALVMLQDITARKQAEEMIARIFDLSLDMLGVAGSDGYFKHLNPAFTQTLGWSNKELQARPFIDFVHPGDRSATMRMAERLIEDGECVSDFENRYRHKDGTWRVLSWRAVPQSDGLVFITARDVTDIHRAENEMHRLNEDLERRVRERDEALESLQNREEEFHLLVDNLLDCVITIDASGIVRSANPMVEKTFGYGPGEIVGENISILIPEPHRARHDDYLARHLSGAGTRTVGLNREVEAVHRDGRLIPVELAVNEYRVHGRLLFLGVLRDISERKRFIAELERAKIEAEQANRAKSAFLATMSHEIRTPMNGVVGMVEVLEHSPLTEHQADLVRTIHDSASVLLGLIDDILDFSKIEAERLDIEHVPVSVGDIAESLCGSLVPLAVRKGVALTLFVSPEIPALVLSDEVRLRQMLYNLVGNAIKFSPARPGRPGRVSVRIGIVEGDSQMLTLTVADNGIGMIPEVVDSLFTPFNQAEVSTTRRFGGTGLGLAICKRLVDLMGGEISASSAPGEGSTFTVTIPLEVAPEQPLPSAPDLTGLECLLAGDIDTEMDIEGMRIYLESAGARVRLVASMDEAAAIAAGRKAPVLAICFAGQDRLPLRDVPNLPPNLHHLVVTRGRRRRARHATSRTVTIDGDAMGRLPFLWAVAVAVGWASRDQIRNDSKSSVRADAAALPATADDREKGGAILVAEDDEINRKVILQQLSLLGHTATVAQNGKEAISKWRKGDFALLLTDLHMPEMDGYTLVTAIRREEEGRRMPIVVLTANALRGEEKKAHEIGVDGYLTKPVSLRRLKEVLDEWLPPAQPGEPSESVRPGDSDGLAVDIEVLRALVGDEDDVVCGLLSDFIGAAHAHADDLRMAASSGDHGKIAAVAHKLKSSSRSVGALVMGDLCAELEKAGTEESSDAVISLMVRFEKELSRVVGEIRKTVKG